MSHADRDWWRDEEGSGSSRRVFGWGRTRVTWTLLAVLLGVWLVASGGRTEIGPGGFAAHVYSATSLSADAILSRGEVWRLVSYGGLHEPHALRAFAWTTLLLITFGRAFEREAGGRRTLAVFVAGVLLAAVAWIAIAKATGVIDSIADPSGGTLALAVAHARRQPRERWGRVPLAAWAAGAILARGLDLALSGGASWAALVVGAAAGWGLGGLRAPEAVPVAARRETSRAGGEASTGVPSPERARLDALLEKISALGLGSLSGEERAFLERESKRVRDTRKP